MRSIRFFFLIACSFFVSLSANSASPITDQDRTHINLSALLNEVNILGRVTQISDKKPILYIFSATWCPPCKIAYPIMKKLQNATINELQIVYVEIRQSNEAEFRAHASEPDNAMVMSFAKDQAQDSHIAKTLAKIGVPSATLVKAGGKVAVLDKYILHYTEEDFRQAGLSNGVLANISKALPTATPKQ